MKKSPESWQRYSIFVAAGVVVLLWAGTLMVALLAGRIPDKAGEFGDMFGAVNSLFTGLAFVGLIYANIMQRKELELQRDELKQTREEFRRMADSQIRAEPHQEIQADVALLSGLNIAMTHIAGSANKLGAEAQKIESQGLATILEVIDPIHKRAEKLARQHESLRLLSESISERIAQRASELKNRAS